MASGAGAGARRRWDREPGRGEREEEEKLKTSQVEESWGHGLAEPGRCIELNIYKECRTVLGI